MPISWKGTLQQYVGRLHRLHDNKRVMQVYDYVDDWVPMLERTYERRLKG
jgi:superfamily II DNA or RNA helicase